MGKTSPRRLAIISDAVVLPSVPARKPKPIELKLALFGKVEPTKGIFLAWMVAAS
jgi:hypothetical protein